MSEEFRLQGRRRPATFMKLRSGAKPGTHQGKSTIANKSCGTMSGVNSTGERCMQWPARQHLANTTWRTDCKQLEQAAFCVSCHVLAAELSFAAGKECISEELRVHGWS